MNVAVSTSVEPTIKYLWVCVCACVCVCVCVCASDVIKGILRGRKLGNLWPSAKVSSIQAWGGASIPTLARKSINVFSTKLFHQ